MLPFPSDKQVITSIFLHLRLIGKKGSTTKTHNDI